MFYKISHLEKSLLLLKDDFGPCNVTPLACSNAMR
jgi:hypothetical protein